MKQATKFHILQGWKILLADIGVNIHDILKMSRLPEDIFAREDTFLSPADYFAFWNALDEVTEGLNLPLLIADNLSVEAFDPPIFACLCSRNLSIALNRLCQFKRLIGPLILKVTDTSEGLCVAIDCYGYDGPLPASLAATELAFFTQLARLATREKITPVQVKMNQSPGDLPSYQEYFGVKVEIGNCNEITFSTTDALKPFLTENKAMWDFFEPQLQKRLQDLDAEATTRQRVKSVLLELLPSGQSSMENAAQRLAMSSRTMQRKLSQEGISFKSLLQETRQSLAEHYLEHSDISPGEISFLLGFQDTNSFIRAYTGWTGVPPGKARDAM